MSYNAICLDIKRNRWMLIASVVWIILVGASFLWNQNLIKKSLMILAESELRSSFEKDVIYRQWAAMNGGVYVPVSDKTPPNPYLSHLPNRDVTTTSGIHLTLVNPAYMTRQVHELGEANYRIKGHITSLNPLRPENAPDKWETRALKAFGTGTKEKMSIDSLNGTPYIRFMRPLITTAACLKCHESQGYKEGDIRGGISVSTPLAFYSQAETEQRFPLLLAHLLIVLMGLFGIWLGCKTLKKSKEKLQESEMRFRQIYDHMEVGVARVSMAFKIEHANHAYCRMLGYTEEELIGKSLAEITHPEVVETNIQKQKQLGTGEISHYRMEKRFIHKKGHTVHGILDANLIRNYDDKPIYFLGSVVDITRRKLAEKALRESERQKHLILNSTSEVIAYFDMDMQIIWANRALVNRAGKPSESLIGMHCHEVWFQQKKPCKDCPVLKARDTGIPCLGEKQTPDNRWWTIRGYPVFDESGQVTALVEFAQDITEQKLAHEKNLRLEEQFHQAQKLESIGRLAGGVAHDLNNLLSPILGYAEMLLEDTAETGPNRDPLEEIVKAGIRARNLVRQLLAFSRKQSLEFTFIDLNTLLGNFEKLLRRTIREDIFIEMTLARSLPLIKGDVGQLEQVVMNLAVNAQDAMPDGGKLIIETGPVYLDEFYAAEHKGVMPGAYVMLTVCDTGCGMDVETCEHLFEPFFTTKSQDKGTGLGLATVFGIVKQHSGNIWVYSEPGLGTAFKIYLPVSNQAADDSDTISNQPTEPHRQGAETILLVEDNPQVKEMTLAILKRQGYTMLVAESGKKALDMANHHHGPLHLLLTDVIMPEMNGKQLYETLSDTYPDIKVVYMSGYTDDVISHRGVMDPGVHFIPKPFTVKALTSKVREALDE